MDDSPRLVEGLGDKLDKGSVDGRGLDKGPGVGMDDGAGLTMGLVEIEKRRSEVEALRAEIDEGAMDRGRGMGRGDEAGNDTGRQAISQTCR